MNAQSLFSVSDCYDLRGNAMSSLDCSVLLATGGHFQSAADALASYALRPFQPLMNTSPASFVNGVLLKFRPAAAGRSFPYMYGAAFPFDLLACAKN
jgi:hypothetical protein